MNSVVESVVGCLTELFLPVEPEITENNDELTDESNPEGSGRHGTSCRCKVIKNVFVNNLRKSRTFNTIAEIPFRGIREHSAGTESVGSSCTSDHDTN